MPRPATDVPALDQRRQVRLSDFRSPSGGALRRSGTLHWRYDEHHTVSLNWRIDFPANDPDAARPGEAQLELAYLEPSGWIRQRLGLARLPSNLGRGGGVWYFVCPRTGGRCRTLYHSTSGFVSRRGLDGVLYRSQQLGRAGRVDMLRLVRHQQFVDLSLGWLLRPGVKRSYGGRLTRPMRRWLKLEQSLRQTVTSTMPPAMR